MPESLAKISRIPFVPRQVMLETMEAKPAEKETKRKEKKTKKEKKSLPESLDLVQSDGDDSARREEATMLLLRSIAAYLKSNGFSKTFSALREEAQVEIDDQKASPLKLEELIFSVLESSDSRANFCIDWMEEKGLENGSIARVDEGKKTRDASGHIHKKKRKKISEQEDGKVELDNGSAQRVVIDENMSKEPVDGSVLMSKKKKSKGLASDVGTTGNTGGSENLDLETQEKKRKKKSTMVEGNDSMVKHAAVEKPQENTDAAKDKDKKKKKKKDKSISGSLHADVDVPDGEFSHAVDKENGVDKTKGSRKSKHRKERIMAQEENGGIIEKQVSTKRKRSSSEENGFQADQVVTEEPRGLDDGKDGKLTETLLKAGMLLSHGGYEKNAKKRKTEKSKDNSNNNSLETIATVPFTALSKDNSDAKDSKRESEHQLVNGNPVGSVKEGEVSVMSTKKEKHSAEPKTGNAFQRVKIDKVSFADDRLKDNSYWAKDGADIGYGAKAQEVLGQVRGRDFRHEKTKKKRGSYRGGQIDLLSHSIKFNYSDDE